MRIWLRELDRVLRGEATRLSTLRDGGFSVSLERMAGVIVALGVAYGLCMGVFALAREDGPVYAQLLASSVKVPLLFLLTLVVTFPSLYVFNALVGSRMTVEPLLKLLVAALGVNLAVLASFGPIVAFFSVSTTSYPFMVLLNVVLFAVAGFLGLVFLLQTLNRLNVVEREAEAAEERAARQAAATSDKAAAVAATNVIEAEVVDDDSKGEGGVEGGGALDALDGYVLARHVKTVFRCWVVVFGLVGAQMGWVLRPFVGSPNQPFTLFRERGSNFFQAVIQTLGELLTG